MSCLHISYFEGRGEEGGGGGGGAFVALQALYYGCVDFHCPSPTLPIEIKNMKCEGGLLVKKGKATVFLEIYHENESTCRYCKKVENRARA